MLDPIDVMKYDRSIFLCIFQEGYLRNLLIANRYNPKAIKTIIGYIEQFIRVSYCPKKYIDMVMNQLLELYDMDDADKVERNAILDETIVKRYTLSIKDEYYREQLMYIIGQIANSIIINSAFDEAFMRKAFRTCTSYVKTISTISKDEDYNKVMKKNYVNGLIEDLINLCGENYDYLEALSFHLEKLVNQVESIENIDGFTHYNSYLRIRDINGIINESNFENAIEVLVRDTNVELDILSTHTNPNYIINEKDNMQELCNKEGYYRCVNALIKNNKEILDNKQFVKTVRAMIQLGKTAKVNEWLGDNIELIKER